jgi:hypothetical protein
LVAAENPNCRLDVLTPEAERADAAQTERLLRSALAVVKRRASVEPTEFGRFFGS